MGSTHGAPPNQEGKKQIFANAGYYLACRLMDSPARRWVVQEKDLGFLTKNLREGEKETVLREYYGVKISLFLLILAAGSAVAVVLELKVYTEQSKNRQMYLEKNSYGDGGREEEMLLSVPGVVEEEPYNIWIEERKYTEEETKAHMQQAAAELGRLILGENASLDHITEELYLPDQYSPGNLALTWSTNPYGIIDSGGAIIQAEVGEGAEVELTVQMSYETYIDTCSYTLYLYPRVKDEREVLIQALEEEVERLQEEALCQEELPLPDQVEGRDLIWKKAVSRDAPIFFGLFLLAAIAVYLGKDQEIKKAQERQERELVLDYPEILCKIVLFMNAGLTIPGTLLRISQDYGQRGGESGRTAYEELIHYRVQVRSGVGPGEAIENYGKRIGIHSYRKLSALLAQSLQKGSQGLVIQLEAEMFLALEERKSAARKIGEETGTKLLLPMGGMLVIVLIILLVPALLSFQL